MASEAAELLRLCVSKSLRIATAESCTGGLLGGAITGEPGSSAIYVCGFITYSNESKTELLGVPAALIEKHGAVSEPVARAMAEGALGKADFAVSITGIAGPGGESAEKPIGLVFIAVAGRGKTTCERHVFKGDRTAIRAQGVQHALNMLINACKAN